MANTNIERVVKNHDLKMAQRICKATCNYCQRLVSKGISINENYEDIAMQIISHKYTVNRGFIDFHFLTNSQLDGIIGACKYWLPYIKDEDLSKLIVHSMCRMAWIHTAVLSSLKNSSAYIGNILTLLSEPELVATTIVHPAGNFSIL